jgi:hypothetical protein
MYNCTRCSKAEVAPRLNMRAEYVFLLHPDETP